MTDDELSNLLQEWKRTPAPLSLTARVFGSRRPPKPNWWDRIPGSLVATTGAAAGVLGVWALITLVSARVQPTQTPLAQQAIPPVAPPAAEASGTKEVTRQPARQPGRQPATRPAAPRRKTKPVVAPATVNLAVVSPRLLKMEEPVYPAGLPPLVAPVTVKLRIKIDKEGRVIDASVIEGDPLLDPIALEAVKGWLYEPYSLNGIPAEITTEVRVFFGPRPKKK